jgi:hypothetical protein
VKYRFALISIAITALAITALQVGAVTDTYTSGFYTRGSDTALYMEQGGSVIDPFYIPVQAWSLLPRITLTASQDDNIFLKPDGEESATTIDLVPGLLFIYGRPDRNHLYADGGMIIPLYDDAESLDEDPSYLLTLGGLRKTGKSQLAGRAGYRRIENADTLVGARIVKEDYIGDLGAEYRVSAKSSVGINGIAEFHEYDDEAYNDYDRLYGAGRLYHRATARSEGFLQVGVGRDDIDTAPADFGDSDFLDVSLGLRGKQSPKTSISGRVGYMWRTYDDGSLEDVNDWIASLGAETTPFGLTTFTADLSADLRPAVNSAGTTVSDQRLTVGANRRLFVERLRGNASLFIGQVEYYGSSGRPVDVTGPSELVFDGRNDEYWGFSLGVDWWTRENFSVGLNYSYFENRGAQDASDDVQEQTSYESGRWTLRVSWNY